MRIQTIVFIFGILFAAEPAHAQLDWERTEIQTSVTAEDSEITAQFPFRNKGRRPVFIEEVKPDCGCTTTELAKWEYAPGDSGLLSVTFHFGQRVGQQTRTILVRTDDPDRPETRLTLKADIPETLEISPMVQVWKTGEPIYHQTSHIRVRTDFPIELVAAESNRAEFKPILKTVTPGREYQLIMIPRQTGRPLNATVLLTARFPDGKTRSYYAYPMVKPAPVESSSS